MTQLPSKLHDIVEDFSSCLGQEKLEYLLEFAEQLPELPPRYAGEQNDHQVHECMTPIFIYAENEDGCIHYFFNVPAEAPTVRGFAAIMYQGLSGLTPAEITAVPNDFYLKMGLQEVLSGQRLNGISAILRYMKRLAIEHKNEEPS